MAVQMNGRFDGLLEGLNHIIGVIGGDQTGHVFDTNTIGAHGFKVFGLVDKIVDVVYVAAHAGLGHGIADTSLKMFAAFFNNGDDGFEITIVI